MPDGTAFSFTPDPPATSAQQPFSFTPDPAPTTTPTTTPPAQTDQPSGGFSFTPDPPAGVVPSAPAPPVAPAPAALPPVPSPLSSILPTDQTPTVTVTPQPPTPAVLPAVAPPTPAPTPDVPAVAPPAANIADIFNPPVPPPAPAPMPLEDRMVPQPPGAAPSAAPGPQIPDQVTQNATGFENVIGATKQGWQNTPDALTPAAVAFAQKWGLGTNARDVNLIVKALGAGFSGGLAMIYETAKGLGMPEPLARDLTAMAETGGMTGAPHVPGAGMGPHMRSLEEQAFMPTVTPDRGPGPRPAEPARVAAPEARPAPPPPPEPPGAVAASPVPEPPAPAPAPVPAPPVSEPSLAPAVVPPVPSPAAPAAPAVTQAVAPATQPVPAPVPGKTTEPVPVTPPVEVLAAQAAPAIPASETPVPPETAPAPPATVAQTETGTPSSPAPAAPATTPPDDGSGITAGGPGPAAPVGQTGAASVLAPGEPQPVVGQGDQIPGAGDHQPAPLAEPTPATAAGQPAPAGLTPTDYTAANPHPQSIATQIDQLEQLGRDRTPEQTNQLQDLYQQRQDAEAAAPEIAARQARIGQLDSQISTLGAQITRQEARKNAAISPPAALVGNRAKLDDLIQQRRALVSEHQAAMPAESQRIAQQVFGPPKEVQEPLATAPGPAPETGPGTSSPVTDPAARQAEISQQLTALQKTKSALNGQITRARNAGRSVPPEIETRRSGVIDQIAALEREHGEITRAAKAPRSAAAAPTDAAGAKQHFDAQATEINKGTMNDAAKRGDKPADGTLLWFLDGNKKVYQNANNSDARLYRGDELSRFSSITARNKDGTSSRIWFKNGQHDQAVRVAQALEMPFGAARDRALGLALGYSPKDVEAYVGKPSQENLQPDTTVSSGTSGPVEDQGPGTISDAGGPFPRGRYLPKDLEHYKLNDGTSVYRSVFQAAGVDPDLAVNRPLTWQNKVLSDHLKDHFGFRNVTVAPGTNPMYARDTMLELTRAAQDMAHALGMRPQLISLDGRLAFQIKPRGKREYFGAYDGGTKTIHLVNDANSFGHEWVHALDHHLTEQLLNNPAMQNLLSRHTREGALDTRDGTQAAFAKLINTMFYDEGAAALHRVNLEQQAARVDKAGNPTKGALEAQRNLDALDKGASRQQIQPSEFRTMAAQFGKPSYWASAHEMLARTGEAWIARQMENNGVDPRGVVMADEAYLNTTDRRLKMTFPKDAERAAIFSAYTDLFDRLRNDGIITGPTAPKADFPAATIGWAKQTTPAQQRTSLGQAVRRELNGLSTGLHKLRHPMQELAGGDLRPKAPGGLSRSTRTADIARTFLYSYGAHMKVVIARNPGAGGRALQAIYDKLSPDPGSGRAVGETFGEEHRALDNRLRNQMGRIFENNGISNANQMTALENAMIHHVMTTGEATYQGLPVPRNLIKISGQLQNEMLNPLYRELEGLGHQVGVAPNGYFPRIYDEAAIYSDPQGFHAAATKMHQVMFDKDVGTPGDDPGRLLERWTQLTKAERATAPASLASEMKALRKNLREQAKAREALTANPNDPTLQAKLDQLETEAKQLATDNHDLVRDHVADLAASDWKNRILEGDPLSFETTGPSGRFLNRRVLPPEADQIMAKYMHIDPRVALPRYFDSVSRRIVWTRLFGKEDKFLRDQVRKATDAGVPGPDLQRFQALVDQATGRLTYKASRDVQKASQQLHAMGAVMLMSRSAWSSLAEPINAAMATGEMAAAWHSFANQFASVFRSAGARERAEIADMLGVTTSSAYDSIMQARTGAEYADSPATDRFMTAFYKASFLTQLTTAQRRASVGTSDWLLRKWSRDLLSKDTDDRAADRRDDAERMFKELGITTQGNNLRDQFANWILSHDGPVPAAELQSSEFRGVYGMAVRRLVDRMVQSPYKIDRPQLSGTPILGLVTQLMSFNYAYVKNILEPMTHRVGHAWSRGYQRGYDRAKAGGAGDFGAKASGFAGGARGFSRAAIAAGVTVAATILASMITSVPRQYIFDHDNWEKHEKTGDLGTWLLGLGVSRSGISGTFDPLTQVFDNLRYQSDLSSLFEGATPAYLLRNIKDLIMPWAGQTDSPNSNTAYNNQARAFYNLIMQPLEVIGLTMMNAAGGPATQGVTSAAMQFLTSPQMANAFANFMTGPKGTSLTVSGGGADDEAGAGLPPDEALGGVPGLEGEQPDGKPIQPGGGPQGNAAGNAALGLADDFAAPLFKAMQKPWSVLPGPAKLAVASIMTALYGIHWWNETAPWRDHPKQATQP